MNHQTPAQPTAAQCNPPLNTIYETYLQLLTSDQLAILLNEVETRLGTDVERDDDLERAQTIAHRLSNVLTGARLARQLSECGEAGFSS